MKNSLKPIIKDFYYYIKTHKVDNPNIPAKPRTFIFICKGNICRSPFAEYLAKKMALEKSIMGMTFSSAGLNVPQSIYPPKEVLAAAELYEIKLLGHKSKGIDNYIIESYDMIIAMENWHVWRLRELYPSLTNKIYLLPTFKINKEGYKWRYSYYNISDPYGKTIKEYIECFKQIDICINDMFKMINNVK